MTDISLSMNNETVDTNSIHNNIVPDLRVASDTIGVELLARPDKQTNEKDEKSQNGSVKSEEFNFFKDCLAKSKKIIDTWLTDSEYQNKKIDSLKSDLTNVSFSCGKPKYLSLASIELLLICCA